MLKSLGNLLFHIWAFRMKSPKITSKSVLTSSLILLSLLLITLQGKRMPLSNADKGQPESRIHGGKEPPEGKYPSLARIEYWYNDQSGWVTWGVGSIINRDWILTSGGIFSRDYNRVYNISRIRVVVGDSSINYTEPYEQIVYIERFILHERFDGGLWSHAKLTAFDIAVAKVTPAIKFSNRVTAVNLPTCNEFEMGTGWVAGWGDYSNRPNETFVPIDKLMEVHNLIITIDECNHRIHDDGFPDITLTDLVMCTREENNKGVCFNDWGAPLFLIKNDSYMVQIGIFSVRPVYFRKCGYESNVAGFTRVSRYLGWIHRRISGCGNHRFHNITEVLDD